MYNPSETLSKESRAPSSGEWLKVTAQIKGEPPPASCGKTMTVHDRRNLIIALIFGCTFICYLERQGFAIAFTELSKDGGLSEATKGAVMSAFFYGYALMQIPGGYMAARFGGKFILSLSFALWSAVSFVTPGDSDGYSGEPGWLSSLFGGGSAAAPPLVGFGATQSPAAAAAGAAAAAAAGSAMGLGEETGEGEDLLLVRRLIICRVLVGAAQGMFIPAAHTVLARWVPPYARSRLVSLAMSGMYLGSAMAMAVVPPIVASGGPAAQFRTVGIAGGVWWLLWVWGGAERPTIGNGSATVVASGGSGSSGHGSSSGSGSGSTLRGGMAAEVLRAKAGTLSPPEEIDLESSGCDGHGGAMDALPSVGPPLATAESSGSGASSGSHRRQVSSGSSSGSSSTFRSSALLGNSSLGIDSSTVTKRTTTSGSATPRMLQSTVTKNSLTLTAMSPGLLAGGASSDMEGAGHGNGGVGGGGSAAAAEVARLLPGTAAAAQQSSLGQIGLGGGREAADAPDGHPSSRRSAIPWGRLLRNRAVLAILCCNFAFHCGVYVVMNWTPTYFEAFLGTDLVRLGTLKMLPYIAMFVFSNAGGALGDWLVTAKGMTTRASRKTVNGIGLCWAAAALTGMATARGWPGGVAWLTMTLSALGLSRGGWSVNHLDIAPRYAGVVMAIANGAGTLAGVVGVWLTGVILEGAGGSHTAGGWHAAFGLVAAVCLFAAAFFAACAEGEVLFP